jgi:hypothetical protein
MSPTLTGEESLVDYLRGSFCSTSAVAISAGNPNSIDSSEAVTSTAVPKVATERQLAATGDQQPHQRGEDVARCRLGGGVVLVRRRRVGGDRRVGLVASEDHIERLAHRCHLGIRQRALGENRRVAGGEQHLVALAERDL